MAIIDRAALKLLFETGDTPNGSNFSDFMDSFVHKDDDIPAENVEGLAPIEVSVTGSNSYLVPAGKAIVGLVLDATMNGAFSVGTTPGGDEIDSDSIVAGVSYDINYFKFTGSSGLEIFFTGSYTANIYLR